MRRNRPTATNERSLRAMTKSRMPTTLPSPVDRDEFRFVTIDPKGAAWQWIDEEMICVPVAGQTDTRAPETEPGALH